MGAKIDQLRTLVDAQTRYIATLEQIQDRQEALIATLRQQVDDAEQRMIGFTARLKTLDSETLRTS